MLKDIIEERIERKVLKVCDFDFESKLWSDQGFDEFKSVLRQALAETAQIVAREVLRKVREGVPEEDDGLHPDTKMPQYLPFNEGTTIGWNECRTEVLTHLQSLEEELSAEVLSK